MKKLAKQLWQDESAQGATEYILLLVAIVALVMLFKGKLIGDDGKSGVVGDMVEKLTGNIKGFMGN